MKEMSGWSERNSSSLLESNQFDNFVCILHYFKENFSEKKAKNEVYTGLFPGDGDTRVLVPSCT